MDTHFIRYYFSINSHIKRVEELLNLKIPSSVINEINTLKEDFIDFYLGNKNIILGNFKNKSETCKENKCHEIASIIGKKLNDTNKKDLINDDNDKEKTYYKERLAFLENELQKCKNYLEIYH